MSELTAYGTALIKCAKRKCGWTGKETDLARKPHPTSKIASQSICPKCGCDGYYFVKEKKGPKP